MKGLEASMVVMMVRMLEINSLSFVGELATWAVSARRVTAASGNERRKGRG